MLVIGNGESRKNIPINELKTTTVGCNAIFRDYNVDHLVCVDKRMMKEALESNVNDTTYIYTRPEWFQSFNFKKVRQVPNLPYIGSDRWDEPFQWGSGPYALLIASLKASSTVHMLGFDLHSKTKNVNNIYKSTKNYDDENKRAVDPRYWIHQISKVFEYFPHINFKIYQENNWKIPQTWKFSHVTVDNISNIYYNL